MERTAAFIFSALLAAPCIGSFIDCVAERIARGRPIASSRSSCDHCGRTLAWRDLVPIASWIALKGRCRYCGQDIGYLPLLSELAALATAGWALAVLPPHLMLPGLALGWTLILLAVIDLRSMRLPNFLTLPLLLSGLLTTALFVPQRFIDHTLGAAMGFVGMVMVAVAYEKVRGRAGLGGGDAKLLGALGAWIGWQGLPSVLLMAGITGLLYAALSGRLRPSHVIPFGPALALGGWVVWLHGPLIIG